MNIRCLHCPRKAAYGKRGLCMGCYMTPRVRALYPPRGKFGAAGSKGAASETMADLDALIAEQAATMPPRGVK